MLPILLSLFAFVQLAVLNPVVVTVLYVILVLGAIYFLWNKKDRNALICVVAIEAMRLLLMAF